MKIGKIPAGEAEIFNNCRGHKNYEKNNPRRGRLLSSLCVDVMHVY
jgi:hypothetical protein